MRYFKLFEQFSADLNEASGAYDYGCVMVYFKCPDISNMQDAINPEHLDDKEKGIEDEHHVTLLYGIHSHQVSDEDVIAAAKGFAGTIELKNVGMFQNDCDVLKFEASNPTLHACNFNLKKLPHTSSYPNYEPHSTIAYLKKGMGQRYVDQFDGITHTATPTHLVYSKQDGSKINIEI